MNETLTVIRTRKSVRKFKPDQLTKEEVETIVAAGLEAPSGHNSQPVYYTIVQNEALLAEIDEATKSILAESTVDWIQKFGQHPRYRVLHSAPTVIFVSTRDESYSPVEDASAAIQNMLLAATSLRIGSVWVGLIGSWLARPEAKEKLDIPEGFTPRYAICFGYEDPEKKATKPARRQDMIKWL